MENKTCFFFPLPFILVGAIRNFEPFRHGLMFMSLSHDSHVL
jgi:hypothetical protein